MGQNGVITRQTYAQGVLLESSNAETWTPLNGSDLTVKIYGYDFQPSGEVRFQPVTGVQFSELNLDEYSAIPEGTGIVWEYSTDGGTTWDAIVPAEEENLPKLWADGEHLLRAFSNLILNAVQAMPGGGRLAIEAQELEGGVLLQLTDTGLGMDQATRENIFNPFFTTKDKGTGLGLAITHKIIQEHGGTIEVASTPGEGTTFTVKLPGVKG